jgi:hypothetical protein
VRGRDASDEVVIDSNTKAPQCEHLMHPWVSFPLKKSSDLFFGKVPTMLQLFTPALSKVKACKVPCQDVGLANAQWNGESGPDSSRSHPSLVTLTLSWFKRFRALLTFLSSVFRQGTPWGRQTPEYLAGC